MGPERAPIPMILATGAVHTHLVRSSLRTFTSLNVRAAECLDVHYFAVLVGVGATTINAYLAQESIADRQARGLFGKLSLKEAVGKYKKAVDKGLLKVMSKLGISMIASYRGGYNFEAIGLSRALVGEFFPGMASRISGIGLPGIAHKVLELHRAAWFGNVVPLDVGGALPPAPARRDPRLRQQQRPPAADRRRLGQLPAVPPLRRHGAPPAAGGTARPPGFPHRRCQSRSRSTTSRVSPKSARSLWRQAFRLAPSARKRTKPSRLR